MQHSLHDLARHNSWANGQILDICKRLDPETLNASVPGTYGSIMQLLGHIIGAETSYLFRLTCTSSEPPWQADEIVGLDTLTERAAILAETWETFLAAEVDTERMSEARSDDGTVFAVPAGVIITQAFHHGSEHRAQICTILGALGQEPPDVSGWGYAVATGRSLVQSAPNED